MKARSFSWCDHCSTTPSPGIMMLERKNMIDFDVFFLN